MANFAHHPPAATQTAPPRPPAPVEASVAAMVATVSTCEPYAPISGLSYSCRSPACASDKAKPKSRRTSAGRAIKSLWLLPIHSSGFSLLSMSGNIHELVYLSIKAACTSGAPIRGAAAVR